MQRGFFLTPSACVFDGKRQGRVALFPSYLQGRLFSAQPYDGLGKVIPSLLEYSIQKFTKKVLFADCFQQPQAGFFQPGARSSSQI